MFQGLFSTVFQPGLKVALPSIELPAPQKSKRKTGLIETPENVAIVKVHSLKKMAEAKENCLHVFTESKHPVMDMLLVLPKTAYLLQVKHVQSVGSLTGDRFEIKSNTLKEQLATLAQLLPKHKAVHCAVVPQKVFGEFIASNAKGYHHSLEGIQKDAGLTFRLVSATFDMPSFVFD
jgi:hypothetical protein